MTWRKREIADEAHSNRTTMNIYTSQSEYLKVEVQRLSALVRAQQITIDKLEAQQEQEPVVWGVDWGKDGNSVSIIKRLADGNIEVLAWEYAPYTPQRTWVGLTDEEIQECLKGLPTQTIDVYARRIEAKLKEKNT